VVSFAQGNTGTWSSVVGFVECADNYDWIIFRAVDSWYAAGGHFESSMGFEVARLAGAVGDHDSNLDAAAGRFCIKIIGVVMLRSFFLLSIVFAGYLGVAEDLPQVNVSHLRKVFDNGEHNAFTDLVKFRGQYYLAFRSCPDGHMVHPTASIIVLRSDDRLNWEKVHQFSVPLRDTRDPHFLVFKDKLFVYTGTWYSGESTIAVKDYDLNLHLGYAVFTQDGDHWSDPQMLEGTFGHYIWKANEFGGKAYLCGRRKHLFDVRPRGEGPDVESAMLESEDGLTWRKTGLFQETRGDETAFQFLQNGSVVGIARRGGDAAEIVRSDPPYDSWERTDLDRYIGGPLLVRWGDRWVVGGRRVTSDGPRTSLCWLQDNQLHEFAELPSGGDNSYPGLIDLGEGQAMVSWYSSHERDENGKVVTAIYLADLTLSAQ